MEQLRYEVLQEFKKGNFVVKWKESAFNEVSADHSLEWLNGILVNEEVELWALPYNLRWEIAERTHEMFGLVQEDTYSHNESAPARIVRDNKDEESLISVLEQHHVFSPTSHPECLFSIATKGLATVEIQESLLGAKDMGQKQVKDFVQQWLTEPLQQQPNNEQGDTKVQFTDTMHENNALLSIRCIKSPKGAKRKKRTRFYALTGVFYSVLSLLTELVEK
ncbi:Hypothetical predicted protein [Paramuricea clavata]|uniref:Uncharacterized protein n=1 Tax=Paramuricea clavata TaxID=317549 RepID=A0A6S7GL08_PARCT|nr:Hypothetical predicted protein [Paramuricea clavata]